MKYRKQVPRVCDYITGKQGYQGAEGSGKKGVKQGSKRGDKKGVILGKNTSSLERNKMVILAMTCFTAS